MRRIFKLSLCLIAGSASACKLADIVHPTPALPYAGVRFINAVPDSAGAFGMDFRFVDILESNAQFRQNFRNGPSAQAPFVSTGIQYKGALEGNRQFRIFLDDSLQSIASVVLKDTTVALVKGRNYTAILWGAGRQAAPNNMHLDFWQDTVADPVALVALSVINATGAAIDVRAYRKGGALPAAATWANVAPYSKAAYVTMAPDSIMYNVQPAGGGAALVADALALPGALAGCSATVTPVALACTPSQLPDIAASPGTLVAGSGVSGIVFPASTAGARTPQGGAFANRAITFTWDRRPPNGCGVRNNVPLC